MYAVLMWACLQPPLGRDRAGRERVRGNGAGAWYRWGVCCLMKGRGWAGWRVRLRAGEEIGHHLLRVLWYDQSQAGAVALQQRKGKGKSTSVGLSVLRHGGKCCHEEGMGGIL